MLIDRVHQRVHRIRPDGGQSAESLESAIRHDPGMAAIVDALLAREARPSSDNKPKASLRRRNVME